ncbi:hypothetical protein HZS_3014 [Henneguya salminicola]|nr:hypothetical protein HZS_3014 [Henneguya salminicola]
MTPRDIQSSLIAMIDILLAYSYDVRISEKEHTVESAWNIVTLSSTLSCNRIEIFKSIDECIISFFRRSLSFPLYRNYNLSLKIGDDLKALLKLGKMNILRCLLKIYSIFNSTERYYLVNEMFIKDFLIWIQKIPDNSTLFISFLQNAEQINFPQKKDLDLDLEYYETSAQKIIAEHSDLKPVYPHKTN